MHSSVGSRRNDADSSKLALLNPVWLVRLRLRARAAARYAAARGAPGMVFDRFGRQTGLQLMAGGAWFGVSYWLTPVNSVRYFEFPFTLGCLPERPGRCLDVSSPRLFSLYLARHNPAAFILMTNPDCRDLARTTAIASRLHLSNLRTKCCGVEALPDPREQYDCIWSISVVEHIAGEQDDSQAIRIMYDSLRAGGRLILTVPVDRAYRDEYRSRDYYGAQAQASDRGQYFFQRVYDRAAVWERLLQPIGQEPAAIRWFGETTPGRQVEHERRWLRDGHGCTVHDPREIAEHFREYATWEEMPGMGVCGLMIEK